MALCGFYRNHCPSILQTYQYVVHDYYQLLLLFFVDGTENYVFARIIFIHNIYYDDFPQATFNYRRDNQAI